MSLVDKVTIALISVLTPSFVNGSFETPSVASYGGFVFRPAGSGWIFINDSGIQSNGGFLKSTDPSLANAPDGVQTAFVESYPGTLTGAVSQSVNFPNAGIYNLSYKACGWRGVPEPLQVSVDGVAVGAVTPSPESYTSYITSNFTITTPGSHTIIFAGTTNGDFKLSLIDLAKIVPVASAGSFSLTAASPTVTFIPGGNGSTSVTIAPTGGFTGVVALKASAVDINQAPVPGITAAFNPNAISLPDANSKTSTVTISATSAVPEGTYTLTITGTDSTGTVTNSTTVTVKVSNPQVTVTLGSLSSIYASNPVTTTATASVDFLPGGYSASDLVATWSYSTGYIVYSFTGTDDFWNDPGDASTASVTLNGPSTSPVGTFNGTFNTVGYYEACIGATVKYHNPTTGENFGPYTGYDFASNDSSSGNATPLALGRASSLAQSAGLPASGPAKSKVKVSPVSVANIQYKDPTSGNFVTLSDTIYVLKNTTLTFKAVPNPSTATFASGAPTWSGTSGASDSGATISLKFTTESSSLTDYKTVIASTKTGSPVSVNVIVVSLTLKQLSFSGVGSHTVKNDLDGSPYTAPQWQDNSAVLNGLVNDPGDHDYPLCYTQGSTATVSVLLVPVPTLPAGSALITNAPVTIKGTPAGGPTLTYGMASTIATVTSSGFSVDNIPLSSAFPATAYCYDPILIQWFYSSDNGATRASAGVSDHIIYVTLADPLPTANLYQTVLETGCKAAQGQSQANAAIPKIWGGFVGPNPGVKRADGTPMKYWGNTAYQIGIFTTADLLKYADGRCDSWAHFLTDVLGAQGVTSVVSDIYPTLAIAPPTPGGWSFTGINAIVVPISHAGQNNSTPTEHVFNAHVVAKITQVPGLPTSTPSPSAYTTVYDPSYAYIAPNSTISSSEQKWQDDSLDGYRWYYTDQFNNSQYIFVPETPNKPEVKFTP